MMKIWGGYLKQIILDSFIRIIFLSVLISDQTDKMIDSLVNGKGTYSFAQMQSYVENKSLKE